MHGNGNISSTQTQLLGILMQKWGARDELLQMNCARNITGTYLFTMPS
jgi:hypothetical protein